MNKKETILKLAERMAKLSRADLEIVKITLDALQFPETTGGRSTNETVDKSEKSTDEASSSSSLPDILQEDDEHRAKHLEELPKDNEPQPDLTTRGTRRIRRRYRSREEIGGDPNKEENKYDVKLGGRVPRELRDRFVELTKQEFPTQTAALTEAIEDFLKMDDEHRAKTLERLLSKDEAPPELTARGTPRVRRKPRTREDIGGDPNKEENKYDVSLGGRVPRELRDRFVELANQKFPTQTAALTVAIEEFLHKYQCDIR